MTCHYKQYGILLLHTTVNIHSSIEQLYVDYINYKYQMDIIIHVHVVSKRIST